MLNPLNNLFIGIKVVEGGWKYWNEPLIYFAHNVHHVVIFFIKEIQRKWPQCAQLFSLSSIKYTKFCMGSHFKGVGTQYWSREVESKRGLVINNARTIKNTHTTKAKKMPHSWLITSLRRWGVYDIKRVTIVILWRLYAGKKTLRDVFLQKHGR